MRRVSRTPIVEHKRPFKVSAFIPFLLYLIVASSQRGHRVEVRRDGRWCKATFHRYDYQFLKCRKKPGEPRRRAVSLYKISLAFSECSFKANMHWGTGRIRS